jgi:hypothetical protein
VRAVTFGLLHKPLLINTESHYSQASHKYTVVVVVYVWISFSSHSTITLPLYKPLLKQLLALIEALVCSQTDAKLMPCLLRRETVAGASTQLVIAIVDDVGHR